MVLKEYWNIIKEYVIKWFGSENIRFLITVVLAIIFWKWMETWWVVNIEDVNAYLNVKIPSAVVGCVFLPIIIWAFDIITPGSWTRKASEDPIASAIVLGSLSVGLGLILSK